MEKGFCFYPSFSVNGFLLVPWERISDLEVTDLWQFGHIGFILRLHTGSSDN